MVPLYTVIWGTVVSEYCCVDTVPYSLIDGSALPGIQVEEACHITILLPVTRTPALFSFDFPSGRWRPHLECWRLFRTKVSQSNWYVNCFWGKSSLSISFINFFHKLHRFFQYFREVKLPVPPLLWVLSFLAELINNCWKCSYKSFTFSPLFISCCAVTLTRLTFLQNF